MASVNKPQRPAAKSGRILSPGFALGALISCGVIGGSAFGIFATVSAMHDAARVMSEGPLRLGVTMAQAGRPDLVPKAVKSSRFLKQSESDVRGLQLSAEAILSAHQRNLATQMARVDKLEKDDKVTLMASAAPVRALSAQMPKVEGSPTLVTALVEDVTKPEIQPFDLVLAKTEEDEQLALPDEVPLPETRPATETILSSPKPAPAEKPVARETIDQNNTAPPAKPRRSLFASLFSRDTGSDDDGWHGKNTKVAIYDVSNATVYLPDGTKLRAHSGIGKMRDNPRYEHVKMTGPTPAGTYRLSMREKRFYGVEAIRMTSIDGRDPKNRTGLLTHTNLLRGQIGSHGCVAFQDYQPFLRAFKRGQINTLVVVPELPSSRTQLAALYRKAGA